MHAPLPLEQVRTLLARPTQGPTVRLCVGRESPGDELRASEHAESILKHAPRTRLDPTAATNTFRQRVFVSSTQIESHHRRWTRLGHSALAVLVLE